MCRACRLLCIVGGGRSCDHHQRMECRCGRGAGLLGVASSAARCVCPSATRGSKQRHIVPLFSSRAIHGMTQPAVQPTFSRPHDCHSNTACQHSNTACHHSNTACHHSNAACHHHQGHNISLTDCSKQGTHQS
jgi:hypothetical protein